MTRAERFFAKVASARDGCWLWTGATAKGYGAFRDGARQVGAHRWSYEFFVGPIPPGLTIDHLCMVRACVNPRHLEAVTMKENINRGNGMANQLRARTKCKHGHPFTPENTLRRPHGRRGCRTCNNAKRRVRA